MITMNMGYKDEVDITATSALARERYMLILSCSKRKKNFIEKRPAMDVYDGPIYQALRKRRNQIDSLPLDILIISAKHGLITASEKITHYDLKMTLTRAEELRTSILQRLRRLLKEAKYQEIFINLGSIYTASIIGISCLVSKEVKLIFSEGGMGEKNSQTLRWLDNLHRVAA